MRPTAPRCSLHVAVVLTVMVTASACASGDPVPPPPPPVVQVSAAVNQSSPVQYGFSVAGAIPAGAWKGIYLAPTASYERSFYDGGHDNIISIGVQARCPMFLDGGNGRAIHLGGEVLIHHWRCTGDMMSGCEDTPKSNGIGINGLVALPMADGAFNLWATGGPKYLADFKANGRTVFESGLGWHARVGFEVPVGD